MFLKQFLHETMMKFSITLKGAWCEFKTYIYCTKWLCYKLENILSLEVFCDRYNVDIITDCQEQILLQFKIIKSSSGKFSVLFFCSKDNLMSSSCSYKTISLMEHFCFRIKLSCLSKMHLNPMPRLSLAMLLQFNNSSTI